MTEQQIQQGIFKYLEYIKAWPVITIETNRRGTPDIIACVAGVFVGIEVKRPGKAPSVIQSAQLGDIEAAGGVAFVASSVDEVKQKLAIHFDLPE